MKIGLDWDEWYPVYFFEEEIDEYSIVVNMTEEQIAFVRKAFDDFNAAQSLMEKAYRKIEK